MKTLWFDIDKKDRATQVVILSEAIKTASHIDKKYLDCKDRFIGKKDIKNDVWELVAKIKRIKPDGFCLFRFLAEIRFQENSLKYEVFVRFNDPDNDLEIFLAVIFPRETAFKLIHHFNLKVIK